MTPILTVSAALAEATENAANRAAPSMRAVVIVRSLPFPPASGECVFGQAYRGLHVAGNRYFRYEHFSLDSDTIRTYHEQSYGTEGKIHDRSPRDSPPR